MPSDDVILSLKQIAGYAPAQNAVPSDTIVLQRGGLGGPYFNISPPAFVGTALSQGGDMSVGGQVAALSFSGGQAQFANASINLLTATNASLRQASIEWGTICGAPIASTNYVDATLAATVWSFEGRQGNVQLWIQDILRAGGAPICNPRFLGSPHCDTPWPSSNSTRIATTAFVHSNIVAYLDNFLTDHPLVFTFNGRSGDVVLTEQDIINAGAGGVFDSVALTGIPTAPTAPFGTDTTQIATTEFVQAAINGQTTWAAINSPNFIGLPTAPTPPPGTADGQLATTAFVMNAVTESTTGVATFNGRTGAVTLTLADVTGAGGAPLASPAFSGNPQAPTAAPGNNSQAIATTAFVMNALGGGGVTTFNGRSGAVVLTEADVTGVGGALLDSPQFTGLPTGPTAAPATSTNQLATTAFVMANLGVASFNNRVGAVSLIPNDISAAGGLVNPSVALTGVPTAPTANPGTSTTQLATTQFVQSALSSAGGVQSFNGRAGAVTLSTADVTGAGGAPIASPGLTGTPTAPTAAPGTTSTQIATTAYVMAALAAAGGVTSFNTRAGAVTLQLADITGAGGAPLASPVFTGAPAAPTPAGTSNSTAIATTAFALPRLGAVGGSVPVSGYVGEVVSNNSTSDFAWSVEANAATIIISPGYWLVWGNAVLTSGGGTVLTVATVRFTITPNIVGYPQYQHIWATSPTSGAAWASTAGPMLVNSTVNETISLAVALYGSGGAGNALAVNGYIYALRYR